MIEEDIEKVRPYKTADHCPQHRLLRFSRLDSVPGASAKHYAVTDQNGDHHKDAEGIDLYGPGLDRGYLYVWDHFALLKGMEVKCELSS
jgi:hypothetical protein